MILATTTKNPKAVYAIDLPETLRDKALRAQCPGYRFFYYPGRVARGAPLPSGALDLDTVSTGTLAMAANGTVMAVAPDGSLVPVAVKGDPGQDAVLPATLSGTVTTGNDGKAKLDWSALKLTTSPSWVDVAVVGRSLPWGFDADPTALGVTVSVIAPKTGAVLNISVNLAGDQPAVGARLRWRVWA